jgi:hypothetical protein
LSAVPGFKQERRATIAATFERLRLAAERFWQPTSSELPADEQLLEGSGESRTRLINLDVGIKDQIASKELARFSTGLRTALVDAQVGDVTGSERFPKAKSRKPYSIIHVTVTHLEAGVRVLRHALRTLGVPMATWIYLEEPEEIYEVWGFELRPSQWGW